MLVYKGYAGKVQYDAEADILHGEVLGTRDVITFQAKSTDEIKRAFVDSVDDYLEFCAERGEKPDKAHSGKFNLRVRQNLHRAMTIAANESGQSLNEWVSKALEDRVNEEAPELLEG